MRKTLDQPVSLRPVDTENFEAVIRLTVREDQKGFVATNVYSLAEAWVYRDSVPLAIYAGEALAGFLMYGFWKERAQHWILRLMIDEAHQGKGYGREAMRLLLERMRAIPGCQEMYISYAPENTAARALYASLGFVETGEILEEEVVAVRKRESNDL